MPRKRRAPRTHPQAPPARQKLASQRTRLNAITDKLHDLDEEEFDELVVRVAMNSAALADEPEFQELSFDPQRAVETSLRLFDELQQSSPETRDLEDQEQLEDLSVEIVNHLATPGFRKRARHCLENYIARLLRENKADPPSLTEAVYLRTLLEMPEFPWGICAVFNAIYRKAMQPVIEEGQEFAEIEEIAGDLLGGLGPDSGPEEIQALLADSQRAAALSQRLTENPELYQRLEAKADRIMEELWQAIWNGEACVHIFTNEEVSLPSAKMAEYLESNPLDVEKHPEQSGGKLFEFIEQSLNEIMTPERFQRAQADLQAIGRAWAKARNRWAVALDIQINELDAEAPGHDRFLLLVYASQIIAHAQNSASRSPGGKRGIQRKRS